MKPKPNPLTFARYHSALAFSPCWAFVWRGMSHQRVLEHWVAVALPAGDVAVRRWLAWLN